MTANKHEPVLLNEALAGLAVIRNGCYVDGTYGRGGHSGAILERLGPGGRVLALDKDAEAVEHGRERFRDEPRFEIRHCGFESLREVVADVFAGQRLQGVLLDLGTSSPQLDNGSRGFSFSRGGVLDMRMNQSVGPTASEWLLGAGEGEIVRVLRTFGEERYARRIARAICDRQQAGPIGTTGELAELVAAAVPAREQRIHPATRVFQAVRIAVNRELDVLHDALEQSLDVLAAGGRLAVISFHSLEDRIVKRFIATESRGNPAYAGLPDMPVEARPRLAAVGRLIRPSDSEISANPRSRSGRLRIAERLSWDLAGGPV